tara:strand:- start:4404 stop:5198 length:795 start_codon:yes stop_codon:yes gene_type:complete
MENLVIGFATQFYTLWSYRTDGVYVTDAYGNHHKTGSVTHYTYHKNVTKSLDKVREQYPNVSIDEELRGKTRDFSIKGKEEKPSGYFWFGKYYGKLITEVAKEDFGYCQWAVENAYDNQIVECIKATDEWVAYEAKLKQEEEDALSEIEHIKEGQVVELTFKSNGFNSWWSDGGKIEYVDHEYSDSQVNGYDRTMTDAQIDGWDGTIRVIHKGLKHVNGRFPYTMPMINGKCVRAKNKTFEVTISKIVHKQYYCNQVQLTIEID